MPAFSMTFAGRLWRRGRGRLRRDGGLVGFRLGRRDVLRLEVDTCVFDLDTLADMERFGWRRGLRLGRSARGSEKVKSIARTRMLLPVSGLLAGVGAVGGAVGLTATGFAATGAATGFAATGVAGFATTGAAAFAGGAFGAILSAGCFAVSEVTFSAAGRSATGFAFTTPAAADFAIAASAAGVNDGGSQVNSSRPSVGATAAFEAGAEPAAFGAGFCCCSGRCRRGRLGLPRQLDDFGLDRSRLRRCR